MKKKELNLKTIRQTDKSEMLGLLLDFPLQCMAASDIAKKSNLLLEKRDFKKILFAGLGGSAVAGDLVRSYLYFESRLPISVFREYNLPQFLDKETLVFISSYSGNTEETLSCYEEAKSKGAGIIGISSGGKLKEYCSRDKVTFVEIPSGLPPRCALGYLSIAPLKVLEKLGLIGPQDEYIKETIAVLKELKDNCLNPHIGEKENIAKFTAGKLFNKLPVIYSASIHFDVVVMRLRAQLNENAKCLTLSHVFPEMNHNEIVGWENPKKLFKDLVVLMFNDSDTHPRVKKRMEITREILKKEGVTVLEISSRGCALLSRIFSLIYIGDFISFYLAILYGVDPTPVDRVAYLKNQLAQDS
jgi:glucose/mannose-6-phosphate isomerase